MFESAENTRNKLKDIIRSAALRGNVLLIDEAQTMFQVDERNKGGGIAPLSEGSRAAFETIVSSIPGDGSSAYVLILAG